MPPGAATITQTQVLGANNAANTAQAVSLTGSAGKFTYLSGFQVTGSGATAASVISVTISGIAAVTPTYTLVIPAGVTTSITPLIVTFNPPLQSSAVNTNITVSVPAFGAGSTSQSCDVQGFLQ